MDSGTRPALPSSAESAIEKHPAWAAAINSSGFVPVPLSNRVQNEYWVCESTPLSVETVPLPSFRPPRHSADAVRFMVSLDGPELEEAPVIRNQSSGGRPGFKGAAARRAKFSRVTGHPG